MQELRLIDTFDNQPNILSFVKRSKANCVKPKFISDLQKTLKSSSNQLQLPKSTFSEPLLITSSKTQLDQRQTHKSSILPQTENIMTEKIKQSIDLLKKTTIYDDKPINVHQLFRKAELLSDISHQNKRTIKFIQICQRNKQFVMIQRNSWRQFTLHHGKGILVLPDGRKIKAKWNGTEAVEKCQITYPNKSIYYGPVNELYQKHGDGFIYFSTGQKIEGKFKQGKILQTAVYYNRNGQIMKSSDFKRGLIMNSWVKLA